jgi:alanine dehydrogenase
MKPGSVIFDLAVAQGGNVEGSVADETVERHGVKIIGYSNTPAALAADASALYARNLYNFLSAFWDKEQGKPVLDDEIGNAVRLTQGGAVVNERLQHEGSRISLRSPALLGHRRRCQRARRPKWPRARVHPLHGGDLGAGH